MIERDTLTQLAAIAHRLWCEAMTNEGWTAGSRYDRDKRTHDALIPFERLGRHDQRHARIGIEAQELEPQLVSAIQYQRGPDREFTVEEMRPGLLVGFAIAAKDGSKDPEAGVVESWTLDAEGELDLIRVRWEDGQRSEHPACARELVRRVDQASNPAAPEPSGGGTAGGPLRPGPRS